MEVRDFVSLQSIRDGGKRNQWKEGGRRRSEGGRREHSSAAVKGLTDCLLVISARIRASVLKKRQASRSPKVGRGDIGGGENEEDVVWREEGKGGAV